MCSTLIGPASIFQEELPLRGVTTRFVDGRDVAGFRAAIDERTKAVFLELIGNPRLDIIDLEQIAAIAHAAGVPVIVDATTATPYLSARSTGAPTSSSTRPPSISAATAPASAA